MKHRLKGRDKVGSYILRVFKCPGCGTIQKMPKGVDTGPQHIKDIYCPSCKCVTKHIQIDSDRILY